MLLSLLSIGVDATMLVSIVFDAIILIEGIGLPFADETVALDTSRLWGAKTKSMYVIIVGPCSPY